MPFFFLDDIAPVEPESPWHTPHIFDGHKNTHIPKGFNAVCIPLNGRTDSPLDWREAHDAAKQYAEQGLNIFWDLDLGLFSHLHEPISEQTQYMTLNLSIKHFGDTLWKEFSQQTIGVSLYRGELDFGNSMLWNDTLESSLQDWLRNRKIAPMPRSQLLTTLDGRRLISLFCCDIAVEYINHLAEQMPGALPVCVCLDTKKIEDLLTLAQLLSKERFEKLHRIVSHDIMPLSNLSQKTHGYISSKVGLLPEPSSAAFGVCLPLNSYFNPQGMELLRSAVNSLSATRKPFRLIPEATLTAEWDGLDYLLVLPSSMGQQGIRKLRGFIAAGGTVLSVGEPTPDFSLLPNIRRF